MEKTDDPEVFEFTVTTVSFIIFYFLLFSSIYIRVRSKVNHYHSEKCQKVYWFHLYQKTRKNRNICHRKLKSNSDPSTMSCTRANSDSFVRQVYHAISFLKDGVHMKKTLIEERRETYKLTHFHNNA